mgnify:FL=1
MNMNTNVIGKPLCRAMMAVAIMLLSLQAMAYDFSYTYQGKTLYYDIFAGGTNKVRLTYYKLDGSDTANNHVSGDVVIPSSVEYNGTTYNVTAINELTFLGCGNLTSITIPNSITDIYGSAFSGCSGLTSINVASGNTHYSSADGVLYNISQDTLIAYPGAKTSLNILSSTTTISYGAVAGCNNLTSITIPNNITSILSGAFADCRNLTSITIPSSITYIEEAAFAACHSLNSINVASGNTHYSSIDGVLYNYTRDTLLQCPGAKTSVTIPNGVTTIAAFAFDGCRSLTSVTIPNGVTSIGESAFTGCSNLTSVTIGNGVHSIEWCAFQGCSSLTSITIPNSVTSISQFAFNGCSSLTSINVASGNTHYSSTDGALYNYAQDTLILCPEAKSSINIPNGVTCIKGYVFRNCIGLTSIPIPSSVTYIDVTAAFQGCDALTSINVASGNTRYSSIDGVLYNHAQDSLLRCPPGKNSVSMPNSLTCIYRGAFSKCKNLTSITIPNSVRIIDEVAFNKCSNLTSVTIGNGVNTIRWWAFVDCDSLSSIVSYATVPPQINRSAFPSANNCRLTVPCGSLGAYTASTWNELFNGRIEEGLSFELSVSANDEAYGRVEVETQSCEVAIITATPNEGYEFTAWNDGNTENPRTVSLTSDTAFMAIFMEAVSTPTITLTVNNEAMGSASYTLDGNTAVLTATANEGYNFLTWSDGNTENPRTVTVTSDTAFMAIFSPASSLQEVNAREFALYPNPAKSFVNLEFEALKENTLLQILDLNGRKVRTFDLKAGQETLRIEIGNLPEGVYTVILGNAAKKLIVE